MVQVKDSVWLSFLIGTCGITAFTLNSLGQNIPLQIIINFHDRWAICSFTELDELFKPNPMMKIHYMLQQHEQWNMSVIMTVWRWLPSDFIYKYMSCTKSLESMHGCYIYILFLDCSKYKINSFSVSKTIDSRERIENCSVLPRPISP